MGIPLVALGIRPLEQPDILGQYAKLSALKGQQQQQAIQAQLAPLQVQQAQNEVQQQQMALARTKAMNDAYASAVTVDPNTQQPTFDRNKLFNSIAAAHQGSVLPELQKSFLELDETAGKVQAAKDVHLQASQDYMGELGNTWKASGYDPSVLGGLLAHATANGYSQEAQQFAQAVQHVDPSKYPMIAEQLIQGSNKQRETAAAEQTAQARVTSAENSSKELSAKLPGGPLYAPTLAGQEAQSRATAQGSPEAIAAEVAKAKAIEGAKVPIEVDKALAIQQATQRLLEGPALDQAAERYSQTGQMPSGMRGPAIATQIMRRAAELHPDQNLASNSAQFAANKASYENVTKTLDTLSAFENTGLKNLKQFTDLAAKIPDTGVPWLNTPVRVLDEKLVGSSNMAAVNAARSVALREIARVTNDPKLSSALTDHARAEVEGLSPTSATLPQIKRVAEILQQDMANVHEGLAAQKADIQKRWNFNDSNSPSQPPPSAKVTHRFNPATGKIEEIQ